MVWVVAQLAPIMVEVDPHKKLEAASYVASISLPILATIAGYIAYRQLAEAKDARVASLYLQITENYNSEVLREARRDLHGLSDAHIASGAAVDFGAYLDDVFDALRSLPLAHPGFQLYNSCMRLMEFWEEVGVLARRNLVDCNVLLDYMAGNIRNVDACFMTFVTRRRHEDGNELYANALWLMEQARVARAYSYPGR